MNGSLAGRLLASRPDLHDPNFDRTVTLVLEHDEQGAFGLILNRPSMVSVSEVVPRWESVASQPAVMYSGGPVQTDAVLALGWSQPSLNLDAPSHQGSVVGSDGESSPSASLGSDDAGWSEAVLPLGLYSIDLESDPVLAVGEGLSSVRFFAGYAGWGSGQLEGECAMNAWWVLDAEREDVFCADPERLWARVMRRSGPETQWFAHLPADPTLN